MALRPAGLIEALQGSGRDVGENLRGRFSVRTSNQGFEGDDLLCTASTMGWKAKLNSKSTPVSMAASSVQRSSAACIDDGGNVCISRSATFQGHAIGLFLKDLSEGQPPVLHAEATPALKSSTWHKGVCPQAILDQPEARPRRNPAAALLCPPVYAFAQPTRMADGLPFSRCAAAICWAARLFGRDASVAGGRREIATQGEAV